MNLTNEQQAIINHVTTTDGLTLVSSVAGSGKTTLLKALSAALPHTNGLYLAYNKSIATASKKAFPKTTNCVTTHSLAYQAVVPTNKLKVGIFNYRSITDKVPYITKCAIVDAIRIFCLSSYIDFNEYAEANNESDIVTKLAPKYLDQMANGKIEVTHEFYLKLFHILLYHGDVSYDPFDFVLLDEAGDVNEVTAEIFMLLPTKKRIAVGDPYQNIYTFNHTINCFETLADKGTTFSLSQSFRVPDTIAPLVEAFCRNYMNPNMSFKGVPVKDDTIKTQAYIARTNASLIAKMITLNTYNTPYGLVRSAAQIFKLPLMICGLRKGGFISDPGYTHIQTDYDNWYSDPTINKNYPNALSYISDLYADDIPLVNAIKLVLSKGSALIIDTYKEAKKHEGKKHTLTLTTSHSCKG